MQIIASHTTPHNNFYQLSLQHGAYVLGCTGTPHSGLYSVRPNEEILPRRAAANYAYQYLDTETSCLHFPELKYYAHVISTLERCRSPGETMWNLIMGWAIDADGALLPHELQHRATS